MTLKPINPWPMQSWYSDQQLTPYIPTLLWKNLPSLGCDEPQLLFLPVLVWLLRVIGSLFLLYSVDERTQGLMHVTQTLPTEPYPQSSLEDSRQGLYQ